MYTACNIQITVVYSSIICDNYIVPVDSEPGEHVLQELPLIPAGRHHLPGPDRHL